MNLLEFLGIRTEREKIVQRLLENNHITPSEAVVLLRSSGDKVYIDIGDMSSGAKAYFGEYTSVERTIQSPQNSTQ